MATSTSGFTFERRVLPGGGTIMVRVPRGGNYDPPSRDVDTGPGMSKGLYVGGKKSVPPPKLPKPPVQPPAPPAPRATQTAARSVSSGPSMAMTGPVAAGPLPPQVAMTHDTPEAHDPGITSGGGAGPRPGAPSMTGLRDAAFDSGGAGGGGFVGEPTGSFGGGIRSGIGRRVPPSLAALIKIGAY